MLHYQVDLRNVSDEKYSEYETFLDGYAFICSRRIDIPGVFEVFWDGNEPLEKFIPSDCLQLL